MSKKPTAPKSIFTIGYDRSRLDDFLATLHDAGAKRVVDVRDVVRSHRPEYTKERLPAAFAESGINYQHLQALGVPKPGRDAIPAGRTEEFLAIYAARITEVTGQHIEPLSVPARQTVKT